LLARIAPRRGIELFGHRGVAGPIGILALHISARYAGVDDDVFRSRVAWRIR
jgi:hypothetical protein